MMDDLRVYDVLLLVKLSKIPWGDLEQSITLGGIEGPPFIGATRMLAWSRKLSQSENDG